MATYVQRSCPKCGEVIEGFTRDYRDIGKPYTQCRRCSQIVAFDHITEWDLKSGAGKLAYLGILAWTAVLRGILLPLVYLGYTWLADTEPEANTFLWLWAIGIIGMGIWLAIKFKRDVQESRERMSDPEYHEFVHRLTALKHRAA